MPNRCQVLQCAICAALLAAFLPLSSGCAAKQAPVDASAAPETAVIKASPESGICPAATPAPTATPGPFVSLTQPQLIVFLRRTLHKSRADTFTQDELELISFVELEGEDVSDLTELMLLPRLQTLVLRRAPNADLASLAPCELLTSLTLIQTPLADAAVLQAFPQLTELKLDSSPLGNALALVHMKNLRTIVSLQSLRTAELAELTKQLPGVSITDAAEN